MLAFLADIVGIEPSSLVWGGQSNIAHDKCRLTGEAVNDGSTGITLMDEGGALWHDRFHGLVLAFADDLDIVGVVPNHFGIPLVLFLWVG